MGGGYNEASVVPNTEGLQEVRVISNNFSAEYGRGQAVISMSTKSGTNNASAGTASTWAATRSSTRTRLEQRPEDRQARVPRPRRRRLPRRPDHAQQAVLLHQLPPAAHNNTQTMLMTVPTALERVGDFSQTLIRDESGNPIPARIFDPFNVVQKGRISTSASRSRTRSSRTRIRRAADSRLLSAAEPHAGRRLQHEQLRGDRSSRRSGATARTAASTSAPAGTRSTAAAASPTPRS